VRAPPTLDRLLRIHGDMPHFMKAVTILIVGAGACTAGCSHGVLLPADSANVVPGAPTVAFDERGGVRVSVNGDDWKGDPGDLADHLTPLKIRVVNRSGQALQILYERFSLVGANGRTYRPLPVVPLLHDGGGAPRLLPIFSSANFFVGPRYRDVYPSLNAWPDPLPRDDTFYQRQFRRWGTMHPTAQMQRSALPEGVLGDGGEMSGFLYFENATRHEDRLRFKAEIDEGRDGQLVANIELPLRVN
jgi:hypothetical protein